MSSARSGGKHNYVLNICVICALILTSALVFPQSAFAESSSTVPNADATTASRPMATIMGASNDHQAIARAAASYDSADLSSVVSLAQSAAASETVPLKESSQLNAVAQSTDSSAPVSVSDDGTMTGTDSFGNSYSVTPVFDENSGAQLVNGSVVARSDEGQSIVSSAIRGGFRNLFILDNFSASHELSLQFDLPEGTLFQKQSDGSIVVATEVEKKIVPPAEQKRVENAVKAIVGNTENIDYSQLTDSQIDQLAAIPEPKSITVKAQEKIATISAPWAVDAQGKPVATHYELQGNKLTQIVDATKDTTFPVTADPSWWWWANTAIHCAINVGILFAPLLKASKLFQVLKSGKAGARIAGFAKKWGMALAMGIMGYISGNNSPQFKNASFKTAVKTIWHDAFSIIIDTLKLKPCWNLIWEFIHH